MRTHVFSILQVASILQIQDVYVSVQSEENTAIFQKTEISMYAISKRWLQIHRIELKCLFYIEKEDGDMFFHVRYGSCVAVEWPVVKILAKRKMILLAYAHLCHCSWVCFGCVRNIPAFPNAPEVAEVLSENSRPSYWIMHVAYPVPLIRNYPLGEQTAVTHMVQRVVSPVS